MTIYLISLEKSEPIIANIMLILRKILFYLFVLIYLLCCPLIILYALGFIFHPGSQQIFKTGMIDISTIPSDATIELNQKILTEKSPSTLRNLAPGTYSLKLTLENFKPWERTIFVKAEEVSKLQNLILIPTVWKTEDLSSLWFDELNPLEGTSLLLLRRGETLKDVFIYRFHEGLDQKIFQEKINDPLKAEPLSLFAPNFIYSQAAIHRVFTIRDSSFVIFNASLKGENKFLWIDMKNETPKIEDITNLFIEAPDDILWEPQDERNLFVLQKGNLNRLDISVQAIFPKILENFKGVGLANKKIYFLTNDFSLERTDYEGKNPQKVLDDPSLAKTLAQKNEFLKIFMTNEEHIFFLGQDGSLFCDHPPYVLVERGVKGFSFNKDENHLLVWTQNKIGIIPLTAANKNGDTKHHEAITWLVTNGERIDQAFWANEDSYIIFHDKNKIFLVGIETPEPLTIDEILPLKNNSLFYYVDKLGKIYYLDRHTQFLSMLEIIPSKTLFTRPTTEEKKGNK